MKKYNCLIFAILLLFCTVIAGCGKSDMTEDEILNYLEQRYDKNFTCISSEKTPRSQRKYLDEKMTETLSKREDNNADDVVDVYEDETGVSFHIYHFLRYGMFGSSWVITDDYAVQLLMSNPDIYTELENSPYHVKFFNTLGDGDDTRKAGFQMTISCFDDIRPAVELAYKTIQNEEAILPDKGISNNKENDDFYTKSIIPEFEFIDKNGKEIAIMRHLKFRTMQIPNIPDKENLIHYLQSEYIKNVENGNNNEKLSDEQQNQNFAENIPLYIENQEIGKMKTDYVGMYITEDKGKNMDFQLLRKVCESCGYTFKPQINKLYIKKDDDIILISCQNVINSDNKIFSIYKNSSAFIPDGEINNYPGDVCCQFTISDYQYLFGITIAVDYDEQKAYVQKK